MMRSFRMPPGARSVRTTRDPGFGQDWGWSYSGAKNHAGKCEELYDRMKMTEILLCGPKKADHRIRNSEKLNDLGGLYF